MCRTSLLTLLTASILSLTGCEEPMTDQPTGTVSGVLMIDGQPVGEGFGIVFMQPEEGTAVVGATDPDGKYELRWFKAGVDSEEIPVGTYQIMVQPPGAEEEVDVEALTPEQMLAGEAPDEAPKQYFPPRYRSTATSNLSVQIEEGPNDVPIEMKST